MSPLILGIMASSQPGSTNSYESIQTVPVTTTTTSISFTSIPSTYKHLQIRLSARNNYTGSGGGISALMRLNGDTGGNYTHHRLVGDGATASAGAATGVSYTQIGYMSRNGDTYNYSASVVDILDYTDTSKNTTVRTLSGADYNGSGYSQLWSGLWLNTAAVTNITIYPDGAASWLADSTFALYGIKG